MATAGGCSANSACGSPTATPDLNQYVNPVWVAHRWYGEACGADGSGEPYRSSELWLLSVAKHLTPLLGFQGSLDLRVLGVLASVLVGLAVGLLWRCFPVRSCAG